MVLRMKTRWLLVALLSAAFAVAAGCGGDGGSNPFEGSWTSESGARITFTDKNWSDSDGDSGTYDYTGDDPVYTLTLETATRRFFRRATFADSTTLELCVLSSTGNLGACVDLVFDRPTLH